MTSSEYKLNPNSIIFEAFCCAKVVLIIRTEQTHQERVLLPPSSPNLPPSTPPKAPRTAKDWSLHDVLLQVRAFHERVVWSEDIVGG